MELREVIETRASVRQFAGDMVPVEHLREMVRLAGLAPSINNSQPWRFIAMTNRELLASLAGAVRGKVEEMLPVCNDEEERRAKSQVEWFSTFFEDAPAVIAVVACPYQAIVDKALPHTNLSHDDLNAMRGHPDIESIGASIQNLMLAAVNMGYGTCWLSGPLIAREALEERLRIEQPWRLAAMIAVGKPAHTTRQREKKPVEEIFELIN
ncbi:MAG: nitroreductase family protein [Armatimonadota bacterium]|nr:nitroreductase family protein [bacterium]